MNPHLHPWSVSADGFPADGFASDRLEYLLRYAILAPSPHNTQPWLFRINYNDVELHADPRRSLPVTDPFGRELQLACGAALFNLRVAAEYFGQTVKLELFPDPAQPLFVARFTVHAGGDTTAEDVLLFHAITQRRTNREAFRPDPVPSEVLEGLAEAAQAEDAWLAILSDEAHTEVARLVVEADRRQWASGGFRKELAQWVRTDAEHQADGIPVRDLGINDWLAFAGPAIVRTFNRGSNQAARDADIARQSPVLAVLGTGSEDPRNWVLGGQALQRVLLLAQAEGVSVSYLNQPIEASELRPQVAELCGAGGGYPQVLLRLGYGPAVPPAPRRSVHSLLIKQDPAKAPPH